MCLARRLSETLISTNSSCLFGLLSQLAEWALSFFGGYSDSYKSRPPSQRLLAQMNPKIDWNGELRTAVISESNKDLDVRQFRTAASQVAYEGDRPALSGPGGMLVESWR